MYRIRTATPADEIPLPFTLDEAKAHLRVELAFEDDDALIEAQVRAGMDHVEKFTSQVLTEREFVLALHGFPILPELIEIPRAPVTAIDLVEYTNGDGAVVTLAVEDWRWSYGEPELLRPPFSASWPAAADERGSVRVSFTAGYEEGLAPASLIAAVKLVLGHLYANREAVVTGTIATELPLAVQALCMPYRRVLI